MHITFVFVTFAVTKTPVMEEQEREYLIQDSQRLRTWEDTPSGSSGRWDDMTEMEKNKLLDIQADLIEKLTRKLDRLQETLERQGREHAEELKGVRTTLARAEEREQHEKLRADKEAELRIAAEERVAELVKKVLAFQSGETFMGLMAQIEGLRRELADAKSADKSRRGQMYGRKSQSRKDKSDGNDHDNNGGRPSAEEEKANMGGKDSVEKLPDNGTATKDPEPGNDSHVHDKYDSARGYREGKKHRTMSATRKCVHKCIKPTNLPAGWVAVRKESRFAYEKFTAIIEHETNYWIVLDPQGVEHAVFIPADSSEDQWMMDVDGEKIETVPMAVPSEPINDSEGNALVDCFPHPHATAAMMAELVTDHFVNNIPYYRLAEYYKDHGMSVVRQTLINWLYEGGKVLQCLVPMLLDMAVTKDAVINCDETWCKVRVEGKYSKRYIWCLVNRELKIVIYCYKDGSRSRDALKDILGGREPMALQSDGYNVYLYLDNELVDTEHLCCMAHARAKFFYAWEANHEADAKMILDLIDDLYALEAHYERLGLSAAEIVKRRKGEETSEIVIRIRSKLGAMMAEGHPPRSELLEKAVRYLNDFWTQLFAYRKNGRYTIDNTLAERYMRPISGERKNSLFYGSGKMAGIAAVYHTLISTCRFMKVSVSEYFRKAFRAIVAGCDNMANLLPMNMGLSVNNY